MAVKLNNAEQCEGIFIIIDKEQYPIAYRNKIEELVEQGCYNTIEDAERDNPTFEMDCEIYYDKHSGLFAVECGAVESGTIYSPYSGEICDDADVW
jgi:hypothetical protein